MHQSTLRKCSSIGHFPKIHILTKKNTRNQQPSDYPNNRQAKALGEEMAFCLQGNSNQGYSTVTMILVAQFQPGFKDY